MTREFSVDDLYRFEQITDLHCGEATDAVIAVKTIDREHDEYHSALWRVPANGAEPHKLTQGTSNDRSPQWSPDGKRILFISARGDDGPQVHLLPADGGESKTLTHFEGGVVAAHWAPDGKRIGLTVRVEVDSADHGARGSSPSAKNAPEVAWRVPYKLDGMGFTLNREVHLFVVDAETGDGRQLTDGAFEVKSFGWTPDSKHIVYGRSREGRQGHRTDLHIVDVDSGKSRQLTHDLSSVSYPHVSPDGVTVAFGGTEDEGDSITNLYAVAIDGKSKERAIADPADFELASGDMIQWSRDSQSLYVGQAWHGLQQVARVDLATGRWEPVVTGERHVLLMSKHADRVLFVAANLEKPNQLYSAKLDGSDELQHTEFNSWWAERDIPIVTRRPFKVPDGDGGEEQIDAWVAVPKVGTKPCPLLVDAHGGPQSYALLNCPGKIYWYLLASKGWCMVMPNAVGSSSYGREFARRLRGRWGEIDLAQYIAIVKALQDEGMASERVVMTGKSYGGYLTAWAVSQNEFFDAAIVSAPVANIESHFGTSDTGYYVSGYAMNGETYLDRDLSRRLSPTAHFPDSATPTLFLQGKDDQRCPIGQSEELFTTMMRSTDTPCELVMYPGGDHHMAEEGRPSHRQDYFERLAGWAQKYTAGQAQEPRTRRAGRRAKPAIGQPANTGEPAMQGRFSARE